MERLCLYLTRQQNPFYFLSKTKSVHCLQGALHLQSLEITVPASLNKENQEDSGRFLHLKVLASPQRTAWSYGSSEFC